MRYSHILSKKIIDNSVAELIIAIIGGPLGILASSVKFKKSIAGQRALMTSSLREEIKERDHYTCKKCKNSTEKEPNLLLEIDHIVPLSKGGLTSRDNLQTLCWRCNRSKGAKLE